MSELLPNRPLPNALIVRIDEARTGRGPTIDTQRDLNAYPPDYRHLLFQRGDCGQMPDADRICAHRSQHSNKFSHHEAATRLRRPLTLPIRLLLVVSLAHNAR